MAVSSDAPEEAVAFAQRQIFAPEEIVGPVPTGAPHLSLEKVSAALYDSEINVGMQSFFDCGMRIWIGDDINGIAASGRLEADQNGQWPGEGAAALWLHRTVLRLYPNSDYAKRYGERPDALAIKRR